MKSLHRKVKEKFYPRKGSLIQTLLARTLSDRILVEVGNWVYVPSGPQEERQQYLNVIPLLNQRENFE